MLKQRFYYLFAEYSNEMNTGRSYDNCERIIKKTDSEADHSERERQLNSLKSFVRSLVRLGRYDLPLSFALQVFFKSEKYDLPTLKEAFDKIKIRDGYSMTDLCRECYKRYAVEIKKTSEYQILNYIIDENSDPFESSNNISFFNLNTSKNAVFSTIMENVLLLEIDPAGFTASDADMIAERAKEFIRKQRFEENEERKQMNKESFELEEKYHAGTISFLGLAPLITDKEIEADAARYSLGVMYYAFKICYLNVNTDTGKHIITNYIAELYKNAIFYNTSSCDRLINIDMLIGVINPNYDPDFYKDTYNKVYFDFTKNDFVEAVLTGNKDTLSSLPDYYAPYLEFAAVIADIMVEYGEVIRSKTYYSDYSMIISYLIKALYFTGQNEKVYKLLKNDYKYLDRQSKKNQLLFYILSRCALESDNEKVASQLYGIIQDEILLDTQNYNSFLAKVYGFVNRCMMYLKERNIFPENSTRTYYEIINEQIEGVMVEAKKSVESDKVLAYQTFSCLSNIVWMFSDSNLDLGRIKLYNMDKAIGGITSELVDEGKYLFNEFDPHLAYYSKVAFKNDYDKILVFLRNHISDIIFESIKNSTETIMKIKADSKTDKLSDEAQAEIEKIVDILAQRQNTTGQIYQTMSDKIDRLEREFRENYHLGDQCLFDKLGDIESDVRKYIVTSELTFDYYYRFRAEDREKIDFSPAIVSLTKALELILNKCVYRRMNVPDNSTAAMSDETKSSYFYKNNKKNEIELGSCIHLFMDSQYINFKSRTRRLVPARIMSYKPFVEWNGRAVIDFSKARNLAELEITVDSTPTVVRFDSDSDSSADYNRMVFAKALDYIRAAFRNKVAHKDSISFGAAEECKKLMLETENLLWVLLYLLK